MPRRWSDRPGRTQRRLAGYPACLQAMPEGASPTGNSRTERVSASITLTVPEVEAPVTGSVITAEPLLDAVVSEEAGRLPPRLETKILPCLCETTTPNGAIPTGISCVIECDAVSTTASELLRLNATYALAPVLENAMPEGSGCPESWMRRLAPGVPVSETSEIRILSGPLRVVSLAQTCRSPGANAMPV